MLRSTVWRDCNPIFFVSHFFLFILFTKMPREIFSLTRLNLVLVVVAFSARPRWSPFFAYNILGLCVTRNIISWHERSNKLMVKYQKKKKGKTKQIKFYIQFSKWKLYNSRPNKRHFIINDCTMGGFVQSFPFHSLFSHPFGTKWFSKMQFKSGASPFIASYYSDVCPFHIRLNRATVERETSWAKEERNRKKIGLMMVLGKKENEQNTK